MRRWDIFYDILFKKIYPDLLLKNNSNGVICYDIMVYHSKNTNCTNFFWRVLVPDFQLKNYAVIF